MIVVNEILDQLERLASPQKAKEQMRFFKTGPGEYGEGDIFRGITVPELRKIARQYKEIEIDQTLKLLHSKYHEDRLLALLIWVMKFPKCVPAEQKKLFKLYISSSDYINNWDLIDVACPNIVGAYLLDKDRKPLYKLAFSKNLWENRMAVLATFTFIKQGDFEDNLAIADILLNHQHDLIHKAVGWMLREIGKRDLETEEGFLKSRYQKMPRTMLRYATEKFEETKRQKYLKGKI